MTYSANKRTKMASFKDLVSANDANEDSVVISTIDGLCTQHIGTCHKNEAPQHSCTNNIASSTNLNRNSLGSNPSKNMTPNFMISSNKKSSANSPNLNSSPLRTSPPKL